MRGEREEECAVRVLGHGVADGRDEGPGIWRVLGVVCVGFGACEEVFVACWGQSIGL